MMASTMRPIMRAISSSVSTLTSTPPNRTTATVPTAYSAVVMPRSVRRARRARNEGLRVTSCVMMDPFRCGRFCGGSSTGAVSQGEMGRESPMWQIAAVLWRTRSSDLVPGDGLTRVPSR